MIRLNELMTLPPGDDGDDDADDEDASENADE